MRKGFLLYEEMIKYLTIYEEEADSHTVYDFATTPILNILTYEENLIFFFVSAGNLYSGSALSFKWFVYLL